MIPTAWMAARRTNGAAPRGVRRVDRSPTGPPPQRPPPIPPRRAWLWFAIALILNFLLARYLLPGAEAPLTVPYTLFREQVEKGNVKAIYSRGETMTGRFAAPVTYPQIGSAHV